MPAHPLRDLILGTVLTLISFGVWLAALRLGRGMSSFEPRPKRERWIRRPRWQQLLLGSVVVPFISGLSWVVVSWLFDGTVQ